MMYSGIDELLAADGEARRYFNGLPKEVRDTLRRYGGGINSFEELRHFSHTPKRK